MRRICQLSRRWHQQFLDSAHLQGHHQCLRDLRASPIQQRRLYASRGSKANDVVVHEYEQLGSDRNTRQKAEPELEIEGLVEHYRSEIKKLQAELAEMREGPFGPNSEYMQSLTPEEREAALKDLGSQTMPTPGGLDEIDTPNLDDLLEPTEPQPIDGDLEEVSVPQIAIGGQNGSDPYIAQMNKALKHTISTSSDQLSETELWASYQRCLRRVPNFISLVPTDVWDALWRSQMDLPDADAKAQALGNDMRSRSIPLSDEQLMTYIESLYSRDQLAEARKCWEESRNTLGQSVDCASRFWPLGVEIYCESGLRANAEKIAVQCLERDTIIDATVLVPVVKSWAKEASDEKGKQHTWALYLRFKAKLGARFGTPEYESICTTLLDQGHRDMALAVFRDMLLDTFRSDGKDPDSTAKFWELCESSAATLGAVITEEEVNRLSLTALTNLPRHFENKFFFASWIKNLIGRGHIDSAAKVVELMYERGIRPDARHLNGIVGAWLREKSPDSKKKAEQMAWAMINARIDLVRRRKMGFPNPITIRSGPNPITPMFSRRSIPAATIETFSVLLLHYTRRYQDEQAQNLMQVMTEKTHIRPNSFIYNHWMYASLRAHDLASVWTQYTNLRAASVRPDLETFACLWDAAKVQWDPSKALHTPHFPTPRALFREMHAWLTDPSLPPTIRVRARHEMSTDLYDQIIRVFCLKRDIPGALCAMHGLRALFDIFPENTATRILSIYIARAMPPDTPRSLADPLSEPQPGPSDPVPKSTGSGRRNSRRRIGSLKTALEAVGTMIQALTDQRALKILEDKQDPSQLTERDSAQLRLDVLGDLLVLFLRRVKGGVGPGGVDNEVRMVAERMGVGTEGVGVDFGREND